MPCSRLEFASFLSYTPRPETELGQRSKQLMLALKSNRVVRSASITVTQLVAQRLTEQLATLDYKGWIGGSAVAVPVPSSTLARRDSLWVPDELAKAMKAVGLVAEVLPCLVRSKALPKSATSKAMDRSTAFQHHETLAVQRPMLSPTEILLVDDVVTRGATLLGCAQRLEEAFPGVTIRAFAAMRTLSDEANFQSLVDPCRGWITLTRNGQTHREP